MLLYSLPPLLVMHEQAALLIDPTEFMIHEMRHALRRVMGQQLQTEDGTWLPVKRDVPTASAETFLSVFQKASAGVVAGVPGVDYICALVRWGIDRAERDPVAVGAHVAAALAYFDDLAFVESDASYPCGAILAGVALGLLDRSHRHAASYLSHLTVRDHPDALAAGRRCEALRL